MKHSTKRGRVVAAVATAAVLILASCGSDDAADEPGATTAEEVEPEATDGEPETTEAMDEESVDEPAADDEVGVSLILKNTSNPFFVSMADSAEAEAEALGVSLTVAAGQEDGDTQGQIDAIEAAVARGDSGILITPSGDAVVPALEERATLVS